MDRGDFANHRLRREESVRVDHALHHPNVSYASQQWSQEALLHVAVAYSNPRRWRTRRELFNNFRRHMAVLPNVMLHVGELAYGDRPFEVTSAEHPHDLQLRCSEELWHKKNLLNVVIQRCFPADWAYGAYVDADVAFTRTDIALETIQQLQHYDWVQMFSSFTDLGQGHIPVMTMPSFAARYAAGDFDGVIDGVDLYGSGVGGAGVKGVGATGLAWAFRRESFNACGGLLDTCILGSGDWHMAVGLVGKRNIHPHVEMQKLSPGYVGAVRTWQARAAKAVNGNVGAVDSYVIHHFHGGRNKRFYGSRWKILADGEFDPARDIFRDWQGIWQLTPEKPLLRETIRRYFRSRREDDQLQRR